MNMPIMGFLNGGVARLRALGGGGDAGVMI